MSLQHIAKITCMMQMLFTRQLGAVCFKNDLNAFCIHPIIEDADVAFAQHATTLQRLIFNRLGGIKGSLGNLCFGALDQCFEGKMSWIIWKWKGGMWVIS